MKLAELSVDEISGAVLCSKVPEAEAQPRLKRTAKTAKCTSCQRGGSQVAQAAGKGSLNASE